MPAPQLNVEYVFRLIYECFHGACHTTANLTQLSAMFSQLWLWVVFIGYVISVLALISIVYTTVLLFDLRKREEEHYSTIIPQPGSSGESYPRWEHIQSLADSMNPSDWRTAIIEADIMLDEVLSQKGYMGAGVGEKLKTGDPKKFETLNDAWEAHKVRNQIAHEGSTFNIPRSLAERTIARYESVFREFRVI